MKQFLFFVFFGFVAFLWMPSFADDQQGGLLQDAQKFVIDSVDAVGSSVSDALNSMEPAAGESEEHIKELEHHIDEIEGQIHVLEEKMHNYDSHAGGHDKHHEEVNGLPQLDPTWYPSQIFWLAILFSLLYIPFRFQIIPAISNTIEERTESIQNNLESAHSLKQEAEAINASYEQILTEARLKSSALFERAELKIKDKQQEEYQDFVKKATIQVSDMEAEIVKAKKDAMSDVNNIAAEIASLAAERITGLETDQGQALKFVETASKKRAA